MSKRIFDIVFSILGVVVLLPVMFACGLLVKFGSTGPILFTQTRVGRNFQPFQILKFRSMVVNAEQLGEQITADHDPRITGFGRVMRKTKLDELPQLFNVLCGQMSFVGPRPEVPEYVELFKDDYRTLLQVRPGITDIGSIQFRFEEEILASADDPKRAYVEEILPQKIAFGQEYVRRSSVLFDIALIAQTFLMILGCGNAAKPNP